MKSRGPGTRNKATWQEENVSHRLTRRLGSWRQGQMPLVTEEYAELVLGWGMPVSEYS